MRLSPSPEGQPELPATRSPFRFVFWVCVAVIAASAVLVGDVTIDLPRIDAD
jgi:hypothetical protein